jgi:uncharacterized protein (DUF736 family)
MLKMVNGYLVGKNDETGKIYLSIKVNDPEIQEQLKQLNQEEVVTL